MIYCDFKYLVCRPLLLWHSKIHFWKLSTKVMVVSWSTYAHSCFTLAMNCSLLCDLGCLNTLSCNLAHKFSIRAGKIITQICYKYHTCPWFLLYLLRALVFSLFLPMYVLLFLIFPFLSRLSCSLPFLSLSFYE